MLQPIVMFPIVEITSDITSDVTKGETHIRFVGKTTIGDMDTYIFHAFGDLADKIIVNFKKGHKLTIHGKFTRFTRRLPANAKDDDDYDEYQDVAVKIIDINNYSPLEFITPLKLIKMPLIQQNEDEHSVDVILKGIVKNNDCYILQATGDVAKQIINMKLHVGDYVSIYGTPERIPRKEKHPSGIQIYESIVKILEIDYANTLPQGKKQFMPVMDLSNFRE